MLLHCLSSTAKKQLQSWIAKRGTKLLNNATLVQGRISSATSPKIVNRNLNTLLNSRTSCNKLQAQRALPNSLVRSISTKKISEFPRLFGFNPLLAPTILLASAIPAYFLFSGVNAEEPQKRIKSKEERERILAGIRTNRLVNQLDEEQINAMIDYLQLEEFKEGEVIIKEGGRGDKFYIVESGIADVYNSRGDTIKICYPSDSFGEGGFILNTRRSASVRAKTRLLIWSIDTESFIQNVLASSSRLQKIFNTFASVDTPEGKNMSKEDFWKSMDVLDEFEDPNDESRFNYLFDIADKNRSGLIDFAEFSLFHLLASQPDAEYELAFRVFDINNNGMVSRDDVLKVVTKETDTMPGFQFDPNCNLLIRFFGRDGKRTLRSHEFSQFFVNLTEEIPRQMFRFLDKENKGYISGEQFEELIKHFGTFRMPRGIQQRLSKIKSVNGDNVVVTYGEFIALNEFLNHLPAISHVVKSACNKKGAPINKDEFKLAAMKMLANNMSPLECNVIFTIFDTNRDGRISHDDITCVTHYGRSCVSKQELLNALGAAKKKETDKGGVLHLAFETAAHFGLGAVAGGIGATAVYPIDLVKTRMQNQRAVDASQRLYKNSFDCFLKVIQKEGFLGLYRGLGPQLLGVAPEKAIKLTVNDLLRGLFTDESKGKIYFPLEVLAGCAAGASQVIFTNPVEIVKIRLQVQGESAKLIKDFKPKSTVEIVRELGLLGVYRGAGACLLRDIPFSGIYFPVYAATKKYFADEDGKNTPLDLLLAGALAGMPAASLVTPADVIKTRLQVEARKGEATYSGIFDCAAKVYKQEGFKAFWKGAPARVFRSSPQFGVTLLSYEMLQRWLAPELAPRPPTNAPVTSEDFEAFRRKSAAAILKTSEKLGVLQK